MKRKILLGVSSAFCLCATIAQAQETNLTEQLQRLQEKMDAQQSEIEALKNRLVSVPTNPAATSVAANVQTQSWSPSEPITLARAGSAYMNISFDVLMDAGGSTKADPSAQLELGDHDPS